MATTPAARLAELDALTTDHATDCACPLCTTEYEAAVDAVSAAMDEDFRHYFPHPVDLAAEYAAAEEA